MLEKVTSSNITTKYRAQESFSYESIERARGSIYLLSESSKSFIYSLKFNKATLYSWLCFLACLEKNKTTSIYSKEIGEFISLFEWLRNSKKNHYTLETTSYQDINLDLFEEQLLNLFNDRASSRAANVSSVVTRDLVIWIFYYKFGKQNFEELIDKVVTLATKVVIMKI